MMKLKSTMTWVNKLKVTRHIAMAILAVSVLSGCIATMTSVTTLGAFAAVGYTVSDRRNPEVILLDQVLQWRLQSRLSEEFKDRNDVDVSPYIYNGYVLLLGQVGLEEQKETILGIVEHVDNIKGVIDQIDVAPVISVQQYYRDLISTIKLRKDILRVLGIALYRKGILIVQDSEVYLMGLLTQAEANSILSMLNDVDYISKIINIIEYIDE